MASTTSAAAARTVGIVTVATGAQDTTTAVDFSSGSNFRGVTTSDGTNLWLAGQAGLGYTTKGSTGSATSLSALNLRWPGINGSTPQLYVTSGSGSNKGVNKVGSGLPTSGAQTLTVQLADSASAYGFQYAHLGTSTPAGPDTAYVTDDTGKASGGIIKYSSADGGSTWTQTGIIESAAARGLAISVSGTTVTLYWTTGAGDKILTAQDSSGYNAVPSALTGSTVASAGTNFVFRGLVLVPSGSGPVLPEAPLVALLPLSAGVVFVLLSVARRRRRQPAMV